MTKTYLNEIPYTFGEIIKIEVTDGPVKTYAGDYSSFVGIRNEFNNVEAIAYITNGQVCYIPTAELKDKTLTKTIGDEDERLVLQLSQQEIGEYSVDLGQEFKDRIEQIISEWPNHSFYMA